MMNEIIFLVEGALEGGYTAKAIGEGIFTEGDTLTDKQILKRRSNVILKMIRDQNLSVSNK